MYHYIFITTTRLSGTLGYLRLRLRSNAETHEGKFESLQVLSRIDGL